MTFLDAAEAVLTAHGSPLHFNDICDRALAQGILNTEGKTPRASMGAILAVAVKKKGEAGRFMRTAPSTYGLRTWAATGTTPDVASEAGDRVRIPHYPRYGRVQTALPILEGTFARTVSGMRSTLSKQWGSTQANRDWSDPSQWIDECLTGEQAQFAHRLWTESKGDINPRHILGHWLLSRRYGLLTEDAAGRLVLSDTGREFVASTQSSAARDIDDREGLLKILSLVAELGPARKSVLLEPWQRFLAEESKVRSESYASSTLWARLRNLRDRELVVYSSAAYSITPEGLAWLDDANVGDTPSGADTYQQILTLSDRHKQDIRSTIHELLYQMDPYAFEQLIARLLEEMGYDDPHVTPRGNDKGVDVVATIEMGITNVTEVIQVKRQQGNVQRTVLDALRGSLYRFQADRGTIITTSGFSSGTVKAAMEPGAVPITLIDGVKLVELLTKHNIGVNKRPVDVWELDTAAFSSEPEVDDEG